ncbi:MAG TPA: winged helix DNA-binding domain-containing protein [Streptomyces sp.]|nr:winged helix DNA-binding domain-containing protein [Streptomyces sp.]
MSPSDARARLAFGEVCGRRLQRHGLADPLPGDDPAVAAAAMCGAHAQVMSAAELSVGLRLADVTVSGVRAALWKRGTLVKTFGPRGTVHLLAARDLPHWLSALSALPRSRGVPEPSARLTADQTEGVVSAIADALAEAELTLEELGSQVIDRTGPWAGDLVLPAFREMWPRWRQAIGTAAHRGALCFGRGRGRAVTYTSPARWLRTPRPSADSALRWVLLEYLRAYGPATPAHLAQWLAAPRPWAAELFAACRDDLEEVLVDGVPMWVVAGDTAASRPHGVRLLPYFDAYAVGCHPRERLFPGAAAERALTRGQAGNRPVLLVDGVVAGVWHHRRTGRRIDITVEPLTTLAAARRRLLDAEVERLGVILEGAAEARLGAVTVGPHA